MSPALLISVSIGYVALLFLIAYFTEQQGRIGKSWVNNPYTYSLSLAIYCTAWTFFGSVGKAANSGIDFFPIYLGPTIAATMWWFILRKMVLISKSERITSIADFISSRYGKSATVGIIVTLVAVFCIIPYISIQLKAIAVSFSVLTKQAEIISNADAVKNIPFYLDTAWYIAIALAIFTIIFGTRNLDPNERHEGLVAAVAFESLLKLFAFLAVGIFVVYVLFNGFQDLFTKSLEVSSLSAVMSLEGSEIDSWYWFWLIFISMCAILFLPRQFHIAVVENTNPNFIRTASWLFPLYLLLINIFVLPIAVGGILLLGPEGNPDMFVLNLPMIEGQYGLALLVGIGGFSASTSMVIVAITALSIMISNNLVVPFLLQSTPIKGANVDDISGRLIGIRRVSVVIVMIIAYGFFKFVSTQYTLASIGLISFVGIAQFAPIVIGGMYWKGATKMGAIYGISVGFLIWSFCLPLPTLIEAGVFSSQIIDNGLFNIPILKPFSLMGMVGMDPISHAAFWSLLLNTFTFVTVSLNTSQSPLEITQADLFINIHKYQDGQGEFDVIRRNAKVKDLQLLLHRLLGPKKATDILNQFQSSHQINLQETEVADERLVRLAETHLSGAVGAASAKIMINTVVKEDPISLEELFKVLEQTQEIFRYSKELERKSKALQATTQQLQMANDQLKELDRLKADFIATITHELRTPITSIKALAKILADHPDLPLGQQNQYFNILVNESERIARLVNQVLDLEKLQTLKKNWQTEIVDLTELTSEALLNIAPLIKEKNIVCESSLPPTPLLVSGMRDKLMQALLNLLSNAIKFCNQHDGRIAVTLYSNEQEVRIEISDNGRGIAVSDRAFIFERFAQVTQQETGKPQGTGLGLPITKEIVELHQGKVEIAPETKNGTTFIIRLPIIS